MSYHGHGLHEGQVGLLKFKTSEIAFQSNHHSLAFDIVRIQSFAQRFRQDGRVVKALDLSSNGRMSAWVRTPLLTGKCLWKKERRSETLSKITKTIPCHKHQVR